MNAAIPLRADVAHDTLLQPALREHPGFALGLAVAYGALSGLLATRSAAIWRFAARQSAFSGSIRPRFARLESLHVRPYFPAAPR